MRSSGSPGSWPPSAAELRCVSLTLRSHPETSNLFPEFDGMFMVANWTFLTSHAPARGRIGTSPGAGLRPSAHARSRPACSSRHAARQTRASTRRSRRAVSICSLIVTRPSCQPRSGNWKEGALHARNGHHSQDSDKKVTQTSLKKSRTHPTLTSPCWVLRRELNDFHSARPPLRRATCQSANISSYLPESIERNASIAGPADMPKESGKSGCS